MFQTASLGLAPLRPCHWLHNEPVASGVVFDGPTMPSLPIASILPGKGTEAAAILFLREGERERERERDTELHGERKRETLTHTHTNTYNAHTSPSVKDTKPPRMDTTHTLIVKAAVVRDSNGTKLHKVAQNDEAARREPSPPPGHECRHARGLVGMSSPSRQGQSVLPP
ncbi:hypothetical protein LY76DRAFT_591498 [Colletotrichum caudatum]|nr:hypothetical protein LY76DRAFT_591498 [Colletotrichum caudatum]